MIVRRPPTNVLERYRTTYRIIVDAPPTSPAICGLARSGTAARHCHSRRSNVRRENIKRTRSVNKWFVKMAICQTITQIDGEGVGGARRRELGRTLSVNWLQNMLGSVKTDRIGPK